MNAIIQKVLNRNPLSEEEDEYLSKVLDNPDEFNEFFKIPVLPVYERVKKVLEHFEIEYQENIPPYFIFLIFYLSQQEEDDDPESLFNEDDKEKCLSYMEKYKEGTMQMEDWENLLKTFCNPIVKDLKVNSFFHEYLKEMDKFVFEINQKKELGEELHPLCEQFHQITNSIV